MCMYRTARPVMGLLVAAEDRRLALDAHEDREDRRRDDDVAHGDVALLEVADVAELEHHAPCQGRVARRSQAMSVFYAWTRSGRWEGSLGARAAVPRPRVP